MTSFEVEVQLTLIENKWESNEQASLNEMPEKNMAKKAKSQTLSIASWVDAEKG